MWIPQILQHPGMLQLPCGSRGGWQEGKQLGMSLELQILVYPAQELLLLGFLALGCVEKIKSHGRQKGWSVKRARMELLAQLQPTGRSLC